MCDAKRFSAGVNSVKFWVGPYIVKLSYIPVTEYGITSYKYYIDVKNRKTNFGNFAERFCKENIRLEFEVLTGYSLSF